MYLKLFIVALAKVSLSRSIFFAKILSRLVTVGVQNVIIIVIDGGIHLVGAIRLLWVLNFVIMVTDFFGVLFRVAAPFSRSSRNFC